MFVEVINISDPENWPRDMEKYPTIVEYGVADVYKLGDIYYICYYQVDSSDDEVEIPEDAEFFERYNDEDDSDVETDSSNDSTIDEILDMTKKSVVSVNKMINHHLFTMNLIDAKPNDVINCNRFDLESRLYDYDQDQYYKFKEQMRFRASTRLEKSSLSKRQGDMDNDLSQLFYELVSTHVVTSGKNCWYFDNGLWRKDHSSHYLFQLISTRFLNTLENDASLQGAAVYIGSTAARTRIINDIKIKLQYNQFKSKLDTNNEIIGVENGTLNLYSGKVTTPKVSDLISRSTLVEYIHYDLESKQRGILIKILRKVFPIPELLGFFIRSCSTFLEGENSKKVFYVWWGMGNNCKTGMATLVQAALGDYCGTAPVSLITSKRSGSSEATPELCHIEGKLVVFLQEPNPKEKMQTGRIKELTGNDKMYVRNLYEAPHEMTVRCKIIHVCNFPTASPDSDVAFKRRMIVIKFPSTFVDKREYQSRKKKGLLNETTFRIKEGIEDILKSMGSVFLSLLVQEFKAFKEHGLQVPDVVIQHTEEFLTFGNYALRFIKKQLVSSPDGISLGVHQIYDTFKLWFRDMYPSYSIPNSETFIKVLNDEGFLEDEDGMIHNVNIIDTINVRL